MKFKKPSSATIWGLAAGAAGIIGMIAGNKKESSNLKTMEDNAAEKAAKIVMEQLSSKKD